MRTYLCSISLFLLLSESVSSQSVNQKTAEKVYYDIVEAIGNISLRAPELSWKESERSPAEYNPKKNTISIERKVLQICYSFGEDSLNVLSYILAHELAHHYCNHGWMTQYATLDFSDKIEDEIESSQQRIDDETQADIYGGFYAHIAGYDALSLADQFLDSVYTSYNLPQEISNYPTLDQRKKIINQNKLTFNRLKRIFDMANISMAVGKYNYAQELFIYILDEGFTSREIYNNLGLCYIYEALALDVENEFNLILPFRIDLSSRLEVSPVTRSLTSKSSRAVELFHKAIKNFEISLRLDPNYIFAMQNIYYSNIALSHLGVSTNFRLNDKDLLSLSNSCEFCIKGHKLVVDDQLRKAKSSFKKGSSTCNICDINIDFKNNQLPEKSKRVKTIFDDWTFNGIDMYCKDFRKDECDVYDRLSVLKLCVNRFSDYNLIKIKRKIQGHVSCISVFEVDSLGSGIKNNIDIYIGDHIDKILDNYQDVSIINSGSRTYISISSQELTYLIENERVSRWFYVQDSY